MDSASNLDAWTCHGCGVLMHEACHWGRVASLDEWRVFIRRFETDEPWGQVPEDIAVLCPACRERGGVA
ncbi:MAG TPA: hypothetical protein VNN07_02185 [Candidatus Tectomicrobia bacterium]|nr:hypothetical protein [Candidatus Tectomicrobia bacterium]